MITVIQDPGYCWLMIGTVAELVYAADFYRVSSIRGHSIKSAGRKVMRVQVPLVPPMKKEVKQRVIKAVEQCPSSMAGAAKIAGMRYRTFIERAKVLGVYNPNQSGKGCTKRSGTKIPLNEILDGNHPQYQTNKLRLRLLDEGVKENKCDECNLTEWNKKPITVELDHINGDSSDHRLNNLRMLCPNCHSQTPTFRGKNKREKKE